MNYEWTNETLAVFKKHRSKQPTGVEHAAGEKYMEPVYVMLDSLLQYCKDFTEWAERTVSEESLLEEYIRPILRGMLDLGNYPGGVAMRQGRLDSKDNSVINDLVDEICKISGIDRDSL